MFQGNKKFNQDISKWNTKSAINIDRMFLSAHEFDQDLSNWDIANLKSAERMLSGVRLSVDNYDALLNGWSKQHTKGSVIFGAGSSRYCNEKKSRAMLIAKGFIIEDDGIHCHTDTATK